MGIRFNNSGTLASQGLSIQMNGQNGPQLVNRRGDVVGSLTEHAPSNPNNTRDSSRTFPINTDQFVGQADQVPVQAGQYMYAGISLHSRYVSQEQATQLSRDIGHSTITHCFTGDTNNDGRLDVVLQLSNGAAIVFEQQASQP